MNRILLLILAGTLGMAPAASPSSEGGKDPARPTPGWSLAPHRPAPTPSSPGSSPEVLADGIERDDDVEAFALSPGPTLGLRAAPRIAPAGWPSGPPRPPGPRKIAPRLRC